MDGEVKISTEFFFEGVGSGRVGSGRVEGGGGVQGRFERRSFCVN